MLLINSVNGSNHLMAAFCHCTATAHTIRGQIEINTIRVKGGTEGGRERMRTGNILIASVAVIGLVVF